MKHGRRKRIDLLVGVLLLTPLLFVFNPGLGAALVGNAATIIPVDQTIASLVVPAAGAVTSTPDTQGVEPAAPTPTVKPRPGQASTPAAASGTPAIPGPTATPAAPAAAGQTPAPAAPAGVALGAYISSAPWDPKKIEEYSKLVGATPAVVMWYQNWAGGDRNKVEFAPASMEAVTRRGAMPLVTWEPWDGTGEIAQPDFALREILAGRYDPFIHRWARDAAKWGKPFYLRFAPEMNGDWYPWSPRISGNTAAEYVATWRYVHDIFRQEGATNVRWVWSPNVADSYTTPFAEVYPGDNYVDWIGLVGYNWGTSQPWSGWLSLEAYYRASYDALVAMTDKPLMIAETACTEQGGDKAAWIRQAFLEDLPARFPRVKAVVWFQEGKETDWRVNSSGAALAAYREVVSSPLYRGRLP